MTEPGIDEAFQRAAPAAIVAAGDRFVSRYLSWINPATQGKIITPAERDSLLAAGVDIFLNWEFDAQDELGGAAAGTPQATEAVRQAQALGYPKGATIYYSGDFDETPAQAATVAAYFGTAGPVTRAGGYRVGSYGGYYLVSRLFDAQLIDDGWQTDAWSGGQWDPRAALRQVQNGIIVGGANVDQDERVGTAYSWLHPGGAMTAPDPLDPELDDMAWRMDALNAMSPVIRGGRFKGQAVAEVVTLQAISTMQTDIASIKATLAAMPGGAAAPTATAIAAEVLNEESARLAQ